MAKASNKPLAASALGIDARGRCAHRLLFVAVVVLGLGALRGAHAGDPYTERKTYTYKTVGDLPIKADVYRLPGDDVRPAIVWIHGGGLITGNGKKVTAHICAPVNREYTLAPFSACVRRLVCAAKSQSRTQPLILKVVA